MTTNTWTHDPQLRTWTLLHGDLKLITRELLIGHEWQLWVRTGVGQYRLSAIGSADSTLKAQNKAIEAARRQYSPAP